MEEIYRIRVGRTTRNGGIESKVEFVVKSNLSYNEVFKHYSKQYKGFDVFIDKVEEIEELVIESKNFVSKEYVKILEEKLKETEKQLKVESSIETPKSKKVYSLKNTIKLSYLNKSIELYETYKNMISETNKAKQNFIESVESEILDRYDKKLVNCISYEKMDSYNVISYEGSIVGNIYEIHEIESKD